MSLERQSIPARPVWHQNRAVPDPKAVVEFVDAPRALGTIVAVEAAVIMSVRPDLRSRHEAKFSVLPAVHTSFRNPVYFHLILPAPIGSAFQQLDPRERHTQRAQFIMPGAVRGIHLIPDALVAVAAHDSAHPNHRSEAAQISNDIRLPKGG